MEIDDLMEYATRLADPDFHHEWEDLNKLACLCEDIAKAQQNGAHASAAAEAEFQQTIKSFFNANSVFRMEVERCGSAKRLI